MAAPGYFRLWWLCACSNGLFLEKQSKTYPSTPKLVFGITPVDFSASLVPQPKIAAAFPSALV